jgi:diaminopimelate epimerase
MRFVKAHGAGNDFVLIPDLEDRVVLTPPFVRALCAQHTGFGADGVIRIAPPAEREGEVFMDYWNADGSIAEMCGNGVRCVAKYVMDRGMVAGETVGVSTRGGVKLVRITQRWNDGTVATAAVDMGPPSPPRQRQVDVSPAPLARERVAVTVTTLSMGNPHAVVLVDDIARAPVTLWGPEIEHDDAFPERTNVEFIAVPARDLVMGRIWERGVGETLASGTGASAMAVAAHALGLADQRVKVDLPGGKLAIDWTSGSVWVEGPAVEVAHGELNRGWLDSIVQPRADSDDAS